MKIRSIALLLLTTSAAWGCGSGTGPEAGLGPGSYRVIFELTPTLTTPDPLEGRHEITFRMRTPGTSSDDLELVSSRRLLAGNPTVDGYLTLDRDVLDIREGRWVMRFPYAAGGYTVAWTLVDLGDGAVSVSTGCFGSADGGGTYQAAGCRLDRL